MAGRPRGALSAGRVRVARCRGRRRGSGRARDREFPDARGEARRGFSMGSYCPSRSIFHGFLKHCFSS